jgi:hypothetical protein
MKWSTSEGALVLLHHGSRTLCVWRRGGVRCKAWWPRPKSTCRPLSHFIEYVSRVAVPDLETIFGLAQVRIGQWAQNKM